MEILERLAPSKVSEFLGNKIQIKRIQDFICKYGTIVYVIGPDGCGKTTLCKLLFCNPKYSVLEISKANFTLKDMVASLTNFVRNKTIDSFFNKSQKIVFIDDIDILMKIEKSVLATLQGFAEDFEKHKVACVVCCNISEEKKILDLKKNAEVVKISYPQIRDVYAKLMDADLGIDDSDLLKLVTKHRGCIRDVIMNMYLRDSAQGEGSIINFKDMNNFEVVSYIFKNGINICDIDKVYKEDAGLIGFILYENLPNHIYNHKDVGRKIYAFMKPIIDVNEMFINAAIVESFIYDTGVWKLFDLINILRINGISATLSSIKDKKTPKEFSYKFSQALSKISHKNILNKKIQVLQAKRDMSIEQMFLMADIAIGSKTKLSQDESNFINTYEKYFA